MMYVWPVIQVSSKYKRLETYVSCRGKLVIQNCYAYLNVLFQFAGFSVWQLSLSLESVQCNISEDVI